ncbi:MAG: hypothetical protein IT158_12180 [Bryobacterales bacterium]|nr:hypothetical protein [Bryobacterales bacterium]
MRIWQIAILAGAALLPSTLTAHCDGLDGPVVEAAARALKTNDLNPVLPWIRPQDEPLLKQRFQETLAVRKSGPEAREMADRYFFETVVRIHREGEGAPYTGLKPAGRDLGPAIPAADRAIRTGSPEALQDLLGKTLAQGLHERFHAVARHKAFPENDPAAGRAYVKAYVEFLHYVERLYEAARGPAEAHAHGHQE